MNKIKHKLSSIINHRHLLPFVLFTFIFTVYFSSSVGLMNSMDTPQFFTTEALIQNHNIDISVFRYDPHYFVWPDVYNYKNQTLGLRGYLTSILYLPLHIISNKIQFLFSDGNFPINVTNSPNFLYELSITSLSTIFSVIGLIFIFFTGLRLTNNRFISSIVTLLLSFGTYTWKYSSTYSRHGITVALIGLSLYSICMIYKKKGNNWLWLYVYYVIWSISFGIDFILFFALSIYLFLLIINQSYHYFIYQKKSKYSYIFKGLIIGLIIILANIIINIKFYGTLMYGQFDKWNYLKNVIDVPLLRILSSTPIYPTILTVLFNAGKIPESAFSAFEKLPIKISELLSVKYAKQYNFFGILTISPFLLFGILLSIKQIIKNFRIILFVIIVFSIGIIINTMVLYFWSGTQYDIRYFYPYSLLLSVPLYFAIQNTNNIKLKKRIIYYIIFLVTSLFSLIMGWLGVISMYLPSLTGERRIWMDIYDFPTKLTQHSFNEYLNATFMNRENAWIAVALSIIGYVIFRTVDFVIHNFHFKFFEGRRKVLKLV